ncbi:hypothetical protein MXAN_1734 [Myxococcus xanthus DK 1622]|uniref:Uncharacterized protein n=1 Tax=Myxococcus xanthus (strain DK1622) TaxID=246197 RepID=Q1DBI9_MYXXD|nr:MULTISPECIES: hypothetical protein [Myxococcus]ABF89839.1 hypothetical protein MXAN_1734 [Myxococcus xanthus DK 1622]NOJ54701.1 hypothetical protein [Myxococcus xanthus]QPM81345.1 hypothetical protein I5Q59_08625 [Myxococcus xanthus]QVW70402.1 hypothetical protein JTM82_12915 [Myxococcus xanthus DZ2]QZZ49256.1 hypothetical protein MyxoNM_08600 [Myxococcus xanthus]
MRQGQVLRRGSTQGIRLLAFEFGGWAWAESPRCVSTRSNIHALAFRVEVAALT